MDLTPTPSQTAGPFLHLGCTQTHSVSCIAGPKVKGEHLRLCCRVIDGEGNPVPDAMIEIWQADGDGRYNVDASQTGAQDSHFGGFGRMPTDEQGTCTFETVKPGRVSGLDAMQSPLQAPHLSVSVFARGILKRLATRIYFANDPANAECPILNLVPQERRATLMARPDPHHGDWQFDIRLCGENETVFFDV
jgi:protocatechuate 3,4-dioxygenase, alpha subunit